MNKPFDWAGLIRQTIDTNPPDQLEGGGGFRFPKELSGDYPQAEYAREILQELGKVPQTLGEAYELVAPVAKVAVATLQNNWRQAYLLPLGLHQNPWEVAVLLVDLAEIPPTKNAREQWQQEGWPAEILEWKASKKSPVKTAEIVPVVELEDLALTPRQEGLMAQILDVTKPTALAPEEKLFYQQLGQARAFEGAAITAKAQSQTEEDIRKFRLQVMREQARDITGEEA